MHVNPDAICATRILTALLKRDFIPHKIHPVGGYEDLTRAGEALIQPMKQSQGGSGGVVVCLGVGGLVDLGDALGFDSSEGDEAAEIDFSGVEVWVFDKRRPWNLGNIFGGFPPLEDGRPTTGVQLGKIGKSYRSGKGGIIVFDDGDIEEELATEKEAFFALADMPEVDDAGSDIDSETSDDENADEQQSRKRKSVSDDFDDEDSGNEERPRQRRRSNSGSSIASPSRPRQMNSVRVLESPSPGNPEPEQPSSVQLRKRFLKLRRKHQETLRAYYNMGMSYSEPVSSLLYSLASDLGREDNDLLWLAVVGVSSLELSSHMPSDLHNPMVPHSHHTSWQVTRHKQIQQVLMDEVHRLNPERISGSGVSSPTELSQYAGLYGIEGIVPPGGRSGKEGWGFIKSWGWKASLSAIDVVTLVGAILDVGPHHAISSVAGPETGASSQRSTASLADDQRNTTNNFFPAYDALAPTHPTLLVSAVPLAQHLSRAILRTGTSLLSKNQIRHLRAFRMAVVKEGPDLDLFAGSVGALIKLAGWLDQALRATGKGGYGKDDVPLVVAALDATEGSYVVIGLGAGTNSYLQEEAGISEAKRKEKEEKRKRKDEEREQRRKEREERKETERRARALDRDSDEEDETESEPSDSDSDSDSDASSPPTSPSSSLHGENAVGSQRRRLGNRFGHAFQEVSASTNADIKVDHFDHCVVQVKKEELGTFLEALSMACVVG
ncbi:putative dna replication initiation factor cdc45 [Phaeomoniella chlamydospora]|uniref:Putative dna replication initiation factor cdc45 n=1 Tax=Phaeomoniella chlamydospora TaxID=158046 RepID=A0A0G2E3Z2_PHACM|nr:putative dna replication initiation factor cdc45 [Phaeomoniella chlamydospora]